MKLLLSDIQGRIHVIPDSAIGRDSQPWFLPDFGSNWRGYEAVALRISRLGKGIASKFVERYVDAVTSLWVAEADDCPALDFMDGRVVTGKWRAIDAEDNVDDLLQMIVTASQYATLKTGDIVAFARQDTVKPMARGQRISNPYVNFNIK